MAPRKSAPEPTHFTVVLKRPYETVDRRLTVPAGESIVAAEIVAEIPTELIASKTPAEV